MTLKDRIKNLAQERGMSLPALEAELGFGNSTIVKWDKSTPNVDKLNAVAKYFGVTMDYLLNGVDEDGLNEKTIRTLPKIWIESWQNYPLEKMDPQALTGKSLIRRQQNFSGMNWKLPFVALKS